jgi:hypothetical protein
MVWIHRKRRLNSLFYGLDPTGSMWWRQEIQHIIQEKSYVRGMLEAAFARELKKIKIQAWIVNPQPQLLTIFLF